ncbi:hypothetical protein VB711_04860 [Cronbergia sp. UHCC 0137]|uniref:hypothetical protein n=1 Tax=Cronbergia sp. UHCC 0137 TaxID=3110239 RepID=UPI002B202DE0|nr:hypothetical protein [Cronbergia sp. UHCC 0137]MEA5617169.1 hypothetical protein [Cronbergia sp. UHCC 0137]
MRNRFMPQLVQFRQRLNHYIKNLFPSRYWQKKQILKILLGLICGILVTFVGSKMDWAVTKPPGFTYTTSWIGNTIGNGKLRVQNNIEGMFVTPDGTIYTNSHWDEAGAEAGIYKDGKPIDLLDDTHGWNRLGGKAVTRDDKYIYMAMIQGGMNHKTQDYPPEGKNWYCVRRYDLEGKPAPFKGGRGWDKSMLIASDTSEVTGLAIANNQLFVSNAEANQVTIYDTDKMEEIRKFTVASPQAIAVDKQGSLWTIQRRDGDKFGKIVHYSPTGTRLSEEIKDVITPTAIALDFQGKLLVTENGPLQQVLIYNIKNSQPVQIGTIGSKNGIYSGVAGEVQNSKLYGLTAVGVDGAGNVYVNSNGFNHSGTDLRKFSPSGKMEWKLLGLIFVDNADADPKTDGVDVFTKQERYLMDYSKPAGKQWTYKAYTLNPFKYPQDPRLHTSPDGTFVRRIKGKPYLFLTDMYNSFLEIYRFQPATDGKIAIPAGMFVGTNESNKPSIKGDWPPSQPTTGEWIWRDGNGNGTFESTEYDRHKDYPYIGGWWVDSKGDVWKTLRTKDGIRHYPLQGIDAKGNPIYTYKSMEKDTTPVMFTDLRRLEYFPETDTMYLSGFTAEHPAFEDDAKVVGSEIARFDNWSKGNRTPRWRTVVPYDTTGKREVSTSSISASGDYVFTVTTKTAELYVYQASTGNLIYRLKPGPEVGGESGWIDIPYGIRAFRRSNGEYLVFAEENWKGKVLVYQLPI